MKPFMLAVLIALAAWIKPVTAEERPDLRAVIADQIEAFKAEDVGRAFAHASPMIQGMFRTPENFGSMVKNGYPMVWRPAEVRYLDAREIAGKLWQKVLLTDGSGASFLLDYNMIEVDGIWRINAVQVLELPEVSA